MDKKRKLPARGTRESASKKRASTPPEIRVPPVAPSPPAAVQEPLPKKLVSGEPLPTVATPQPDELNGFQTISESGVLADSLHRSRAKWLSEGIFERYWTKPSAKNKKNGVDLANNPAKESMTKLGTCQIHVEPHIFEAQMFAIKDITPRQQAVPAMPSSSLQPMYRPIIQYGPPNGVMPPPPAPPQKKIPPPQPIQQVPPKPQDTPMKNSGSPAPANNASQAPPQNTNGAGRNGEPPSNGLQSSGSQQAAAPAKNTDPVIQMLAERAASDPNLKALMKIVANGEATTDELKRFQSHIDDLTRLQKERQAAAQAAPPQNQTPHPPPVAPLQVNGNARPSPSPAPSPAPVARAAPTPSPPQPVYQPQPQALRSKGPVPSAKPDISGVVFEFSGGNGDRYLFPKFSILDYRTQGEVVASFLIVRKGSASDSPTYDPELDYYQPMTIRLYAHQGRQLDALQKIVATPDEVRRYMDDIMDNMTRAEYVLLAMRLPKENEEPVPEKEVEPRTDQMENQVLWATTKPLPAPPPVQPVKAVTEGDQYRKFIETVSEKVGY